MIGTMGKLGAVFYLFNILISVSSPSIPPIPPPSGAATFPLPHLPTSPGFTPLLGRLTIGALKAEAMANGGCGAGDRVTAK